MPYQTKAERKRARWMTLTETLKHISESKDCYQTTALKELRKAIADGAFGPGIRWAKPVPPPFGSSEGISIPIDTPAGLDWKKARLRLKGDGAVLDERTKKGNPRWRKPLFLRWRVADLWPLNLKNVSCGKNTSSADRKKPGPIPTKQKIVEAAKVLISRGRTPASCGSWEKFRRELCKELGVDINERGYGVDSVQKAVRPLLNHTESTESTES